MHMTIGTLKFLNTAPRVSSASLPQLYNNRLSAEEGRVHVYTIMARPAIV